MNAALEKYGTVYSLSLQDVLQRRASLVMDRIGGLAYITALYFFWDALLRGKSSFLGYSRAQMLSYVLAMDVLRSFVLSSRGWELVHEIASGKLSQYLLRPVSYLGYSLALDMAQKTAYLAAAILEVSCLIAVFSAPLYIPRDPWTWVLFALSIILSSLLYFLLEFLVSSLAFWTSESGGPLFCLTLFMEFAAGVFFPIDVLPRWAQNILYATPFPYLVFSPISIYLERAAHGEVLRIFAVQLAWLALFYTVLRFTWNRGLRNYSAEGG